MTMSCLLFSGLFLRSIQKHDTFYGSKNAYMITVVVPLAALPRGSPHPGALKGKKNLIY
jgi:hypothetical protein